MHQINTWSGVGIDVSSLKILNISVTMMQSLSSPLYTVLQNYIHNLGNAPLVFVLTFVVPLLMYLVACREEEGGAGEPPRASPSLPLLGNALQYKKHPDVFLAQ
jgi:hypothetical protein